MSAPYGQILVDEDDVEAVKDLLGFDGFELPDDLLFEPWALPAAERFVMRRLPTWAAILQLSTAAAPAVSVVAQASTLIAATYSVVVVAKAAATGPSSPPSAGVPAVVTISNAQAIQVTPAAAPGIAAYDLYVGTTAGQEYLQGTNLPPGSPFLLQSYVITNQGVQYVVGDVTALKAAVASATAGFLCKRFQRRIPEELRSLDYSETVRVDWREEETLHMDDCSYQLGLITTYALTPPPAAVGAHPNPQPNDPSYLTGLDPFALPPPTLGGGQVY